MILTESEVLLIEKTAHGFETKTCGCGKNELKSTVLKNNTKEGNQKKVAVSFLVSVCLFCGT